MTNAEREKILIEIKRLMRKLYIDGAVEDLTMSKLYCISAIDQLRKEKQ